MILSEIQTILMIFVCGCSMNPIKPICLWKLVYSSLLWTLRRCMQLYLMDYALIFHSLKIYMYKDPSLKIHMYKDTRVPVFHISLCDLAEGQQIHISKIWLVICEKKKDRYQQTPPTASDFIYSDFYSTQFFYLKKSLCSEFYNL